MCVQPQDRLKQEARAYQRALQLQMAAQAEEDGELDRMYLEAQDEAWRKREQQWAVQEEARRRLMREVDETRQMQLRLKQEQAEQAAREDARLADTLTTELRRKEREDEERKQAEQAKKLQQREWLMQQGRERDMMRQRERQLEFLENKVMQKEEREYKQTVDHLVAQSVPDAPHRRQKATWFH